MTTLIVGGGWSGLAAAVRLCQQGRQVHLIESARQLGGRARSVDWQGLEVDNGQHLLIGAYRRTLALLADLDQSPDSLFDRLPLSLTVYDPAYPPLQLNAGRLLPWPLSLVWRVLADNGWQVSRPLARLALQARRFNPHQDISVQQWLKNQRQSDRLIRQLWQPLCLATLNTPIDTASAALFARVLTDTFRRRKDSDLLIPRRPLGEVLPESAARYIRQHGGQISLQTRGRELLVDNGRIRGLVTDKGTKIEADEVILATPPGVSRQLLATHQTLPEPSHHAIATVYLQYSKAMRLSAPIIGLSGTTAQWLFDRSDLKPGLVAVVISGPGDHEKLSKAALIDIIAGEITPHLPAQRGTLSDALVIREKKATFACTVDIQQQRPNNRTEITGLWLAGDYVTNPYPATLEGAVMNGEQTATQLIAASAVSR